MIDQTICTYSPPGKEVENHKKKITENQEKKKQFEALQALKILISN